LVEQEEQYLRWEFHLSGGMEIRDSLLEHYPKQQVFSIQQTIQADKQAWFQSSQRARNKIPKFD